jgi:MFS family permease
VTPLLAALGPHGTLGVIAAVLLGAGIVGALLLKLSGARVAGAAEPREGLFDNFLTERPRIVIALWVGFVFLGLGGLTAVSHAAGIAVDYGLPQGETYLGAMLVNLGYIAGALSAGYLSELFGGRRVLIAMGALTAAPFFLLYALPSGPMSLITLACVGAAFGAGTSCYPVTLVSYYGLARMPAIYGRVCTSYGVAGLAAPFIAGALHDLGGNYDLAVLLAAIVGVAGLVANAALPRRATLTPARA